MNYTGLSIIQIYIYIYICDVCTSQVLSLNSTFQSDFKYFHFLFSFKTIIRYSLLLSKFIIRQAWCPLSPSQHAAHKLSEIANDCEKRGNETYELGWGGVGGSYAVCTHSCEMNANWKSLKVGQNRLFLSVRLRLQQAVVFLLPEACYSEY